MVSRRSINLREKIRWPVLLLVAIYIGKAPFNINSNFIFKA